MKLSMLAGVIMSFSAGMLKSQPTLCPYCFKDHSPCECSGAGAQISGYYLEDALFGSVMPRRGQKSRPSLNRHLQQMSGRVEETCAQKIARFRDNGMNLSHDFLRVLTDEDYLLQDSQMNLMKKALPYHSHWYGRALLDNTGYENIRATVVNIMNHFTADTQNAYLALTFETSKTGKQLEYQRFGIYFNPTDYIYLFVQGVDYRFKRRDVAVNNIAHLAAVLQPQSIHFIILTQ